VIQGCKEDGNNEKIDEDKKGVAMQKQGMFLSVEKELVTSIVDVFSFATLVTM
jgi:hypothetical protein